MSGSAKKFDVIVAGNGALANAIAFELSLKEKDLNIALVGGRARPGCATLAAGAMLNAFAELEEGALDHPIPRKKFAGARQATKLWPEFVERLNSKVKTAPAVQINLGTHLVANSCCNDLDDRNFNAIVEYLDEFNEPYKFIDPSEINGIEPEPQSRPLKAIYLEQEGSVSTKDLMNCYDEYFEMANNVTVVDAHIESIKLEGSQKVVETSCGQVFAADQVVLAAGASTQKFVGQLGLEKKVPKIVYGVGNAIIIKSNTNIPEKVFRTPNRGLACGIYAVPYSENYCYVGATNYISPVPVERPRVSSAYFMLEAALEQVNQSWYKAEISKTLVGYRPTTIDTFPLIGETSVDGVWIVSGTKRDGLHLSPFIAQEICKAILQDHKPFENIFKPERELIFTMNKEQATVKSIDHIFSAGYQHDLKMPKSNWSPMVEDAIRRKIEDAYEKSGLQGSDKGIAPEMLDMFRYGHAAVNL